MTRTPVKQDLKAAFVAAQSGRYTEAEALGRQCLKRSRKDPAVYKLLGFIAIKRGLYADCIAHMEKGLRLAPRDVNMICTIAQARVARGEYDAAVKHYRQALEIDPAIPGVLGGLAEALNQQGAVDEARSVLQPVITAGTEDAEAASAYAVILHQAGENEAAVALIRKHVGQPEVSQPNRWRLLMLLGRALGGLARYDESFEAFREANEMMKQPYDIATTRRFVDGTKIVYSADHLASRPHSSNDTELPIFVVSLPRSGSTLIEQILASHPLVHGIGESELISRTLYDLRESVRPGAGSLAIVDDIDGKTLDRFSHRLVGRLRPLDRGAERFVNKHPDTWKYLGLIEMLLPRARVVYLRREPLSVGFSTYMLDLKPHHHPWSCDLRSIGLYIRQFERLMAHWCNALSLPIMEIRYEDLVADTERVTRELVQFCGLPWDDRCLRFYEAERAVATPSYEQVRRPIYTQAVKRHELYAAHLGPLREGLAEAAGS